MKLWELDWTEGKQYRNLCAGNSHTIYTVEKRNLVGANGFTIHAEYRTSELADIDFEPCVDWSKVEVDTKILVSEDGTYWFKRHFAKYEKDVIYVFSSGRTSWSIGSNDGPGITQYKYAKLAESED